MRYFFHIRDRDGLIHDEEGTDLPDLDAARQEANLGARDLILEDVRGRRPVRDQTIEITDAVGQLLDSLAARSLLG